MKRLLECGPALCGTLSWVLVAVYLLARMPSVPLTYALLGRHRTVETIGELSFGLAVSGILSGILLYVFLDRKAQAIKSGVLVSILALLMNMIGLPL